MRYKGIMTVNIKFKSFLIILRVMFVKQSCNCDKVFKCYYFLTFQINYFYPKTMLTMFPLYFELKCLTGKLDFKVVSLAIKGTYLSWRQHVILKTRSLVRLLWRPSLLLFKRRLAKTRENANKHRQWESKSRH